MLVYWILILLPFAALIIGARFRDDLANLCWLGVTTVTILAIGMRYEVGGDWESYLTHLLIATEKELLTVVVFRGDPSYDLLNWASARVGLGIYGVNLVCGVVFVTGLAIFCRRQPIPWLAWLVATPYLLIVVGMGYTRQSVALGLLLWGLAFLDEQKIGRFILLVLIGATFHKTVLLMIPLAVLGRKGGWWIRIAGVILLIGIGLLDYRYHFGMADYYLTLWTNLVERTHYQSQGAFLRIWMNAVPAIILLLAWRPWKRHFGDPGFWNWLAIASVISVILVGIASTAVDRINLYIAPLQLYFWSRFPLLFSDLVTRTGVILAICLLYFVALWVWLNYAFHAHNWVPYKSIFSV